MCDARISSGCACVGSDDVHVLSCHTVDTDEFSTSELHTDEAAILSDDDISEREAAIKSELRTQFMSYATSNGEDAITQTQLNTILKSYLARMEHAEEQDENDIAEQLESIWVELPKTKSGRITYTR